MSLLILLLGVFAYYYFIEPHDPEVIAQEKLDLTLEQRKELAPHLGIVYPGIPKEELEIAGYTEYSQKGYRKEGNEEWITHLNWATKESGDLITFYLKDGKVRGWKEK